MRQFDIAKDCGAFNASDPRWQPGNLGDANGVTALCGHAMGGAQIAVAPGPREISPDPRSTSRCSRPRCRRPRSRCSCSRTTTRSTARTMPAAASTSSRRNEPGLGGFEIKLFDQAGGLGDATGQITYDKFNQPVSNALAGIIDPITGQDACPITKRGDGLVGMIPTCPKYEADGVTQSPLAGQAVIANLYPGLYEIVATPAADRIARGEEWLQTNTLDGGKAHEAFIKPNEPGYFQEFGPGGFHVAIGFANPKIINARRTAEFCAGHGRLQRHAERAGHQHPHEPHARPAHLQQRQLRPLRLHAVLRVGGPPDGADFALEKCDADGKLHTSPACPRATSSSRSSTSGTTSCSTAWCRRSRSTAARTQGIPGHAVARQSLHAHLRRPADGDGVSQAREPGLSLVNTNIRYRDGSIGFFNNTDLNGYAGFNEVFPFMNWLVVETTSTRYKPTGVHTVYDAGGPSDGSTADRPCSGSTVSPVATRPSRRSREHDRARAAAGEPARSGCRVLRDATADCPGAATPGRPAWLSSGAGRSTGRIDRLWATYPGLAGPARAEQLHRVRHEAVRCRRERWHQRPRDLRLDAAVRRPGAVAAAELGARRATRQGQPLQQDASTRSATRT